MFTIRLGFSSIEKLFFSVGVSDEYSLRAISSLCPNLYRIDLKQGHAPVDDSAQLESILRGMFQVYSVIVLQNNPCFHHNYFYQVKSVLLHGLNPKLYKLVLNVFGEVSTTLDLFGCGPIIDMAQLGVCSKLEKLSIVHSPINLEDVAAASSWTPETFLPCLSHFRTNGCLGLWAPLMIERKCRLADISIQCSHIATDVGLFLFIYIML